MKKDIDENEVQSGDLIIFSWHNHLCRSYYFYETNSGLRVISTCYTDTHTAYKKKGKFVDFTKSKLPKEHNDKLYLRRPTEFLIIEKQSEDILEKLKKFIRK